MDRWRFGFPVLHVATYAGPTDPGLMADTKRPQMNKANIGPRMSQVWEHGVPRDYFRASLVALLAALMSGVLLAVLYA